LKKKTDEKNSFFERNHSEKNLTKLNLVKIGNKNPISDKFHTDKIKVKNSFKRKEIAKTKKTKTRMSSAKGFPIFVYDTQGSLINNFSSINKVVKIFLIVVLLLF
jgi:hypothetical protein